MTQPTFDAVAVVKRIHHAVPLNIRYRYTLFFWTCCYHFKKFFNPLFPRLVVLEGQEKNSGAPVTLAYAGSHTQVQEYWGQTVLAADFKKHDLGRKFFLHINSYLRRDFPDCNFILAEHNSISRAFLKAGFFIPEWVDMEIDIASPMERLLGNQREGIQRRIRKFGLTYELTRNPKYFDEFYYKMYLPYMQQRHLAAAQIDTYSALSEIFSRGELILVKNDAGTILCGGLFETQGQKVRCRKMGIRDGNWEYVREGVIGACYYFLIDEMKKRGYKKMHLGGTRPFLSDGVTKFKISLKAQLACSQRNSCVSMVLLKNSPGLQDFLNNNPFICFEKNEDVHRAVFFQPQDQDNEAFNDMIQAAVCYGLADTHIFVFGDLTEHSNYFFSVKPAWPLFDHSTPVMPNKTMKVSLLKKILQRFSVAGG